MAKNHGFTDRHIPDPFTARSGKESASEFFMDSKLVSTSAQGDPKIQDTLPSRKDMPSVLGLSKINNQIINRDLMSSLGQLLSDPMAVETEQIIRND